MAKSRKTPSKDRALHSHIATRTYRGARSTPLTFATGPSAAAAARTLTESAVRTPPRAVSGSRGRAPWPDAAHLLTKCSCADISRVLRRSHLGE
ncbi:unnamed protein product, partial [Iphiclides podalirius]